MGPINASPGIYDRRENPGKYTIEHVQFNQIERIYSGPKEAMII